MGQLFDVRSAAGPAFVRREAAGLALAEDAERVARACHDMAPRFHRGGKLIVFGNGGASTDSNHIAVEFVHPVIVGKRALPAMALTNDPATVTGVANQEGFGDVFAHQLRCFADPSDIALGVSSDGRCVNVLRALEAAHERGLLTVALVGLPAGGTAGEGDTIATSPAVDHVLTAHSDEPAVVKEVHVTTYHILWELVHVFFEQPGLLDPALLSPDRAP
jgi:D-sedoheptulose 7-phosphate isomerase